jgi:aryl-alcohol dehydrogenase-like predicted oxidoreductase
MRDDPAMEYRNLGRSGVKVSPLCLGTMMLGAWGNTDRAECVRIVHHALDQGINFVDTANNYAAGESEEIVGEALQGRRSSVVLATKVWSPMGPGPNERGLSRKAIFEQAEASLRRLKTDYIDLYQIHRPDRETPWEETLSALTDLVRQGKVRYLGCSSNHYDDPSSPYAIKLAAWELVESLWISDVHRFERWISYQPPYSMLRRTMELEHFPATRKHGIGNIVWSPLEGGWLAGKYRRGKTAPETPRQKVWIGNHEDPKFAKRLDAVEKLIPIAARKGVPLSHLAHAFALRNPAVTSVIIGPRTMDQLDDALASLPLSLSDEDVSAIDAIVPPGTSAL